MGEILIYIVFGSGLAIATTVVVNILNWGREAPDIFRPQPGNEWLVDGLLSLTSAFFSWLLATFFPLG